MHLISGHNVYHITGPGTMKHEKFSFKYVMAVTVAEFVMFSRLQPSITMFVFALNSSVIQEKKTLTDSTVICMCRSC